MSTAESRDSNRFQLGRNANPQRVRYKTAIFNEFLATTDHYSFQLQILAGNGDGTFQQAQTFTTPSIPSTVSPVNNYLFGGDFRGNGRTNLAIQSPQIVGLDLLELSSGATASLSSVTVPGSGIQSVIATYTGDSTYAPAISNAVALDTRKLATVSAVAIGSPSVVAGGTLSFTVSVAGLSGSPVPTGTVQCLQSIYPAGS